MSKAQLAAKSAQGQGGCLPREVDEIFFRCLAQLDATSCPRRGREAASLQGQLDDACASLNWLASYRLDSRERTDPPSPMQMDTIARVEGLIEMVQPTPGDDVVHDLKECFKVLLDGRDVHSHDPPVRTLASYRKEAVSLPDGAGEARDFTTFGWRLAGSWRRRKVSRCCGTHWRRSRIRSTLVSICTAIPLQTRAWDVRDFH